ncbi:hypothetical protein TrLO_g8332 [Triparma laevis f. longispina]|uniref:Mic1 domain-containing protein n=1 Tax=Triparma laevis f. longispina TaxID=1714387 RepID=A0A9W7FE27_9STRA|nr:hypothetical protein TrLO_g8332 [Triparma laevis f. longispina]
MDNAFVQIAEPRLVCPSHVNPAATWFDVTLNCFVVLESSNPSSSPLLRRYRTLSPAASDKMVQAAHNASPSSQSNTSIPALIPSRPVEIKLTISTAPPPLLARFSLDYNLLALQVEPTVVHVYSIGSKRSDPWRIDVAIDKSVATSDTTILPGGIVWSDHGGNSQDLTIVTSHGVVMYKVSPSRNQLAKVRSYLHLTHAFWYEPITRCLLLSTGEEGNDMRCFFLIKMNNRIAPRLELPPPDKVKKFTLDKVQGEAFVRSGDASLVCLYGTAYVVDIQPVKGVINLISLNKETLSAELHRTFKMYVGGSLQCSVVDDLLLCHSGNLISFIYDVGNPGDEPVCGGSTCTFNNLFQPSPDIDDVSDLDSPVKGKSKTLHVEEMYDGRWSLLAPDKVLDPSGRGTLWRITVNLKAILTATYSNSLVIPFLMRRRTNSTVSRRLCLDRLKELLEEKGDSREWVEEWVSGYLGVLSAAPMSEEDKLVGLTKKTMLVNSAVKKMRRLSAIGSAMGYSSGSGLETKNESKTLKGGVVAEGEEGEKKKIKVEKTVLTVWGFEDSFEHMNHESLVVLTQLDLLEFGLLPRIRGGEDDEYFGQVVFNFVQGLLELGGMVVPPLVALSVEMLCRMGKTGVALGLLRSKRGGVPVFGLDCLELGEALVVIGRKWKGGEEGRGGGGGEALMLHGLDMLKRGGEGIAWNVLSGELLKEGRVLDAMRFVRGDVKERRPTSFDFWNACVEKAGKQLEDGEKCQFFYFLFSFLKESDPECINTVVGVGRGNGGNGGEKRRGSWKDQERQKGLRVMSDLAKKAGEFPLDIFQNKAVVVALKGMFGFVG